MSNVRGDKSLKKQTVTKFITLLLILGINQSAHSEQQRLGEFEDHRYDSPVTSTGAMRATEDTVQSSEIIYGQTNDQSHQGYLSQPQSTKPTAGLIVIHEWWGLNEDIHLMADQIAGLGYASLAVDLYDGQSATKVKDAFQLSTNLSKNEEAALANLQAAYDYLVNEVGVEKVGIIGWCLGGKWSLRGALMLPNQIDATVIYYGSLIDDKERLATLEMPIIGFVGTKDRLHKQFIQFEQDLEALNKDASFHIYEGARHAFANASGIAYEPVAAEDSWKKTVNFLAAHLD
jgi:carboxymethylenebutenolidase|tara:strand:+ start:40 stop:906 length:867 start_codon:yes stop_codon:yes gene_type:complete